MFLITNFVTDFLLKLNRIFLQYLFQFQLLSHSLLVSTRAEFLIMNILFIHC